MDILSTFSLVFIIHVWFISGTSAILTEYMADSCNVSVVMTTSQRLETATSLNYPHLMDCLYTITVPNGKKIEARVLRFEVEQKVDGVCTDYLNIYDGDGIGSTKYNANKLCGKDLSGNLTSSGLSMTYQFVSDDTVTDRGFAVLLIAFSQAPCADTEFACNSGICIDDSLTCDNYDQCGDGSDELGCEAVVMSSANVGLIAGITAGAVAAVIVIIVVTILVVKKLQKNKYNNLDLPDYIDDLKSAYPVTSKYRKGAVNTTYA